MKFKFIFIFFVLFSGFSNVFSEDVTYTADNCNTNFDACINSKPEIAMQKDPAKGFETNPLEAIKYLENNPTLLSSNSALYEKFDSKIKDDINIINNNPKLLSVWLEKKSINVEDGAKIDSYDGTLITTSTLKIKFNPSEVPGAKIMADGTVLLPNQATVQAGEVKSSNLGVLEVTGGSIKTSDGNIVQSQNSFKLTSTNDGMKFEGKDITINGIGILKEGSITLLNSQTYGQNSIMLGDKTKFDKINSEGNIEMSFETIKPMVYATNSCGDSKNCILDSGKDISIKVSNGNNLIMKNYLRKDFTFEVNEITDKSKVFFFPKAKVDKFGGLFMFSKSDIIQSLDNSQSSINIIGNVKNKKGVVERIMFGSSDGSLTTFSSKTSDIDFVKKIKENSGKIKSTEQSIVDACKSIGIDSSFESRKNYFKSLFPGKEVPQDSATMNIALLGAFKKLNSGGEVLNSNTDTSSTGSTPVQKLDELIKTTDTTPALPIGLGSQISNTGLIIIGTGAAEKAPRGYCGRFISLTSKELKKIGVMENSFDSLNTWDYSKNYKVEKTYFENQKAPLTVVQKSDYIAESNNDYVGGKLVIGNIISMNNLNSEYAYTGQSHVVIVVGYDASKGGVQVMEQSGGVKSRSLADAISGRTIPRNQISTTKLT